MNCVNFEIQVGFYRALVIYFDQWVQDPINETKQMYYFLIQTIFTKKVLKFESRKIKVLRELQNSMGSNKPIEPNITRALF